MRNSFHAFRVALRATTLSAFNHRQAKLRVLAPRNFEQLAIANYLNQKTALIDSQLATLNEQAQLLKKLRKAIIHER